MKRRSSEIGGFYPLELSFGDEDYHSGATALSTGRACIRQIIRRLTPKKFYLPFFTCDALFEPFELENIGFECYGIDANLEITKLPLLGDGEYILYINYFGVKGEYTEHLIEHFGERLIVDNTHFFFHRGYPATWSFTSARKYFGVPDGAYLYGPNIGDKSAPRFSDATAIHNILLLSGRRDQAFNAYQEYERSLDSEIYRISLLSETLLSNVDFKAVSGARIRNFRYLRDRLGRFNRLSTPIRDGETPFCYPLLPDKRVDRRKFYSAKRSLFIPFLWADPSKRPAVGFEWDSELGTRILPLPIDHRYSIEDMETIAQLLVAELERQDDW